MLRAVASRSAAVASRFPQTRAYTHISEPIGKGTVVPLKFDSLKPLYMPRSYTTQFWVLGSWMISNQIPNWVFAIVLIWAAHGGFSGHLPPDPHSLHP